MLESMLYLLPVFIAAALGAITGHVVLRWHYKRKIRKLQAQLEQMLGTLTRNGRGTHGNG